MGLGSSGGDTRVRATAELEHSHFWWRVEEEEQVISRWGRRENDDVGLLISIFHDAIDNSSKLIDFYLLPLFHTKIRDSQRVTGGQLKRALSSPDD